MNNSIFFKYCLLGAVLSFLGMAGLKSQTVVFPRDFSPAEGLVTAQEKPFRDEVCLNGLWELQCIPVPSSWKSGSGIAPELSAPQPDKWEKVKIKIPSAINVNDWGRGSNVGDGTQNPYAPGSVYFPSYPDYWKHIRMGWLRKNFRIPEEWTQKRVLLHFEAVAGDCIVLVNGREAGHNFDSHLPFDMDISDYINRDAENELLVGVRHTKLFDKSHPVYKKMGATYPTGSNTDDLIGIWQDVYLLGVPEVRITDVFVQPWVDKNELVLEVAMTNFQSLTEPYRWHFAEKPYKEGKPGYQYERIPPYVTTFNPGLDPQLPLYKALPMFNALKAALKGEAWAPYKEVKHPVKPEPPQPVYRVAYLVGTPQPELADFITKVGISLTDKPQKANLWIMDAETVTAEDLQKVQAILKKWQKKGGMLLALSSGNGLSGAFCDWLPEDVKLTDRRASALEVNKNTSWGSHFELPDLYFSEMDGDRYILKHGLTGNLIEKGEVIFSASRTDWNLFNNVAEHWKCAQVVLYETLNKPEGVALVTYPLGNVNLALSVIDYHLWTKETSTFWKNLFRVMAIDVDRTNLQNQNVKRKEHDLLMDGPTD